MFSLKINFAASTASVIVPIWFSNCLAFSSISFAFALFIRSRTVSFTSTSKSPNSRVYAFFDRIDVNPEVYPTGSSTVYTL